MQKYFFASSILAPAVANCFTSHSAEKILLHGHCQLKALAGTESSKQALGFSGYEVDEVDSGCCGMAGSFGYEAEHYEISQAMGERQLLPAVRAAEDAIIVASGVSCRQQIVHATGRRALHPVEVLHDLYFSDRNHPKCS